MNKSGIIVGKYFNINSIVHKIDARIKLIFLLVFFVMIFVNGGYESYFYLTAFVISLFVLAKLPFKSIYSQWKIFLFVFIFLFFITALLSTHSSSPVGVPTYSIGKWIFEKQALYRTIYIVWRIFLMIMTATIFTATTKPLHITLALEDLLKPLTFLKIPVHEIAMMMAIALRFIPTFLLESDIIMKAQASRGIDFQKGNLKEKMISLLSLVIPLFLSSFQKAEDLSNAMDARGYIPGKKRSRGTKFKINLMDIIFVLIVITLLILIIFSAKALTDNGILHWWTWTDEPKF